MFDRISCSSTKIRELFFTVQSDHLRFRVSGVVCSVELTHVVRRSWSETRRLDLYQHAALS